MSLPTPKICPLNLFTITCSSRLISFGKAPSTIGKYAYKNASAMSVALSFAFDIGPA